jgi:membrane-associated phospholipid phosphatase
VRSIRPGRLPALIIVTGCSLPASSVLAQASAAPQDHLVFEPSLDLPVMGIGLAATAITLIEQPAAACLPECDPGNINALDRTVLGNYSEDFHTVADWTVISLLLLPPVLDAIDSGARDGFLDRLGIYVETLLIAQGITQLVKVAVRRNAPFVYDESVPLEQRSENRDATRSFFSGHTTTAFAATTAFTTMLFERHPNSPLRWVSLIAGALIAGTVGVLKIEAGYHFWTDVIAGALVGTSIGVLVPLLHVQSTPAPVP